MCRVRGRLKSVDSKLWDSVIFNNYLNVFRERIIILSYKRCLLINFQKSQNFCRSKKKNDAFEFNNYKFNRFT